MESSEHGDQMSLIIRKTIKWRDKKSHCRTELLLERRIGRNRRTRKGLDHIKLKYNEESPIQYPVSGIEK